MQRIFAQSASSQEALTLILELQTYFVTKLNDLSKKYGTNASCVPVEWFRDQGIHGGGVRYEVRDETLFNRGSVNMSQVHYEDDANKHLNSATALSTIIHPLHPKAPSVHMHISWTELKDGTGYWRMMSDLNPSIPHKEATQMFETKVGAAFGSLAAQAKTQGERYFFIPALGRHRGVAHFYLEQFQSSNAAADYALAKDVGRTTIETYCDLIEKLFKEHLAPTESELNAQLDYHTIYFFQVLTLDRGTTSGLLIHNENDIGTLGSLPKYINVSLLASWAKYMPKPQEQLLLALCDQLPYASRVLIDETAKAKLADVVRKHYQTYPQALALQASGHTIPPTVANHTS